MNFWMSMSPDSWSIFYAILACSVGFSCSQTPSEQSRQPRSASLEYRPVADHNDCTDESCEEVPPTQDASSEPSSDRAEKAPVTPHSGKISTGMQTSTSKAVSLPPSPTISPAAPNSLEAQILSGERIYRGNCGTGGPCHAAAKNGPGNVINNRSDQALNIAINSVPSRGGRVIKLTPEEIRDLGVYLRGP
jgi:hypothetical protein